MLSGLLLSAGLSSRFGSPKALAIVHSKPVIVALMEKILAAPLDELIVVLGADRQQIEPCVFKHKSIRVVYNKDYNLGQTSSVQAGLRALNGRSKGFLIFPVDCPFISTPTIRSLAERFEKERTPLLIPTHHGKRGHPPVFDIRFKDAILNLPVSQGLNRLLEDYAAEISLMEVDDAGIIHSFNTPEDLARIKKFIV